MYSPWHHKSQTWLRDQTTTIHNKSYDYYRPQCHAWIFSFITCYNSRKLVLKIRKSSFESLLAQNYVGTKQQSHCLNLGISDSREQAFEPYTMLPIHWSEQGSTMRGYAQACFWRVSSSHNLNPKRLSQVSRTHKKNVRTRVPFSAGSHAWSNTLLLPSWSTMFKQGVPYFHCALGIANYGVVLAHAVGNF